MKIDIDFGTTTMWLITAAGALTFGLTLWWAWREKGKAGPGVLAAAVFALLGFIALCFTLKEATLAYFLVPYVLVVAIAWVERIMLGRTGFFAALFYGAVVVSVLALIVSQIVTATRAAYETSAKDAGEESKIPVMTVEQAQESVRLATEEALTEAEARRKRDATSQPIQVTEMVRGKAWRFVLRGTDIGTAAAEVRTQKPETTIHVKGGHTYRFSAAGVPAGTVHLTSLHVRGDPEVKDATLRAHDIPRGLVFLPSRDSIATVWVQGTRGPVELMLTETSEPPATVRRTLPYFQQSSATGY